MKRRTLLTTGAVVGASGLTGCLSVLTGGGGGGSTPSQETLTPTQGSTATETVAETSAPEGATTDGAGTASASATPDGETGAGTTMPGDDDTATATGTPDVEFGVSIDRIEKCGSTCRTLFYTVLNRGTADAESVGVRIRVFTGGDKVYDEVQEIGPLDARSKRDGVKKQIDVGLSGGAKIRSNDGEVTIELRPRAASGVTETFSFERTLES